MTGLPARNGKRDVVFARTKRLRLLVMAAGTIFGAACGRVDYAATDPSEGEASDVVRLSIHEVEKSEAVGPDAPPRVRLAQVSRDGSVSPLPGQYIGAEEFRDGAAAVTAARELLLVRRDGSHSLLAHEVDGLPAQSEDGALVYAARFGDRVEIHWLSTAGANRRLATMRGTATRFAPMQDGRVIFVGAASGGVAGIWLADEEGAHCLTNCDLRAGQPWGDAYRAPPGDPAHVRITDSRVEWKTAEGSWESVELTALEEQ